MRYKENCRLRVRNKSTNWKGMEGSIKGKSNPHPKSLAHAKQYSTKKGGIIFPSLGQPCTHIFISQNTQKKTGLNTMPHISITISLSQSDKRPLLGQTPPQYIFTLPQIFICHSLIFFPKNRKCQLKNFAQFLSWFGCTIFIRPLSNHCLLLSFSQPTLWCCWD